MDRRPSKSTSGNRLYHYTDDKGMKGITGSQQINPSTDSNRDAYFGQGVYLTAKTPKSRVENLLKNNYDGMNPGRSGANRVKHAVSVSVDDLPDAEKVNVRGRDVWVHPGPIDLSQVPYKVHHKNVAGSGGAKSSSGGYSRSAGYKWESSSPREQPSTSGSHSSRSSWERPCDQWNSSWCSTGSDRRYSESSQACNYYDDSDDDWY